MNLHYLILAGLAAAPISEVRGAIPYGLGIGLNSYWVFALAVLTNIAVVPFLFFILKQTHFKELAHNLFGKTMSKKINKHKKFLDTYGELALLAFVAVPLPITGAWTGTFMANALGMNEKKSILVISLGVVIAGTITFLVTSGLLAIWR